MEKITNRNKYILNLYEFSEKVNLNKELIDALSKHPNFKDDMKTALVSFQIYIFLYSIII
jgi:hypothetical protein